MNEWIQFIHTQRQIFPIAQHSAATRCPMAGHPFDVRVIWLKWKFVIAIQANFSQRRTADHDDRVVPSHTLKYAAQLYHYLKKPDVRLIQRNPVLARVETDVGHGAGKPRDKVVSEGGEKEIFEWISEGNGSSLTIN